jgi:hypothetical protein
MGDFDKNQTPSAADQAAKEKKKLAIVGLLGAVLLGVIVFHFNKGGPQAASASERPIREPSLAVVGPTPAQALANLDSAKDPTLELLKGTAGITPELAQVPRNPFKISDAWLNQLVKHPAALPEVHTSVYIPQTAVLPAKLPEANIDGLKLNGIFRQGDKLYASVSGNLVTVGNTIGNARVTAITSDSITFRHADYPDGPTTTLTKKF